MNLNMYLPKNRYKVEQVNPNDFIGDYTGKVIVTATGRVFQGSSLDSVGRELSKVQQDTTIEVDRPFNEYPTPTAEDYSKGFFTRYFLYNRGLQRGYEVSVNQYNEKRNKFGIEGGTLLWVLKKQIEDTMQKRGDVSVIIKGTKSLNEYTIRVLEEVYPGISLLFSNPIQFVK